MIEVGNDGAKQSLDVMIRVLSNESTLLFESPSVCIGQFRCGPGSQLWSTENRTGLAPSIVFPRTAVEIHQADRYSVVATPNHAMLYNANHAYHRDLIDPRGDVCEFFATSPTLIQEVLRSLGGPISDRLDSPFDFANSPCPADVYMTQRAIFRVLKSGQEVDMLLIEESFIAILPRLLKRAMQFHIPFAKRKREPSSERRDQVEAVKDYISRNYRKKLSIREIAEYIECSAFHLCRIFKQLAGESIHSFLTQFRIRSAIERILDDDVPITDIALDLGFSSHSHFTNTFRQIFGDSPSRIRQADLVNFCQRFANKNNEL